MLQHLSGLHVDDLTSTHRLELQNLQRQYQDSVTQRETSIDGIARAMSELAAASGAPASSGLASVFAPTATAAPAPTNGSASDAGVLVAIDEADQAKCTNCKTCYQDMSEVFEKTRIVVDGVTKEVGRVIPGVLQKLPVTQELISRASRVAANCDAEIIR